MNIAEARKRRTGAKNWYLEKARAEPFLDKEEERRLIREWKEGGDEKARDKVITSHMQTVLKVVRRYAVADSDLWWELVGEGNVGLCRALEKFQLSFGVRFRTYAFYFVRHFVIRYIQKNKSIVRLGLGSHIQGALCGLSELKAERGIFFRPLSDEEVSEFAAQFGLSDEIVQCIDRYSEIGFVPIGEDSADYEDDGTSCRNGVVLRSHELSAEESVISRDWRRKQEKILLDVAKGLDTRKRTILYMRYVEERNFAEIARFYKVRRQAVTLSAKRVLRAIDRRARAIGKRVGVSGDITTPSFELLSSRYGESVEATEKKPAPKKRKRVKSSK